jgi:hypothetical protein
VTALKTHTWKEIVPGIGKCSKCKMVITRRDGQGWLGLADGIVYGDGDFPTCNKEIMREALE